MEAPSELSPPPLNPPLATTSAPRDKEPDIVDTERLRRWQEDRIARKLRGEYESAVLHLAEVINANLSTPLRIASVRIEGAVNTRKSFLSSLVTPFLAKPVPSITENAPTLEHVLHTTRHIGSLLQETDLFKSVEGRLEPSRDALAQSGDVDVVFKTLEKGRYYLNTSTQVGNNEGGASATCRVRNAFGGAETFEANLAFATKTRVSFNASLSAPLPSSLTTRGELSIYGAERDNSSYSSSSEGLRGFKAVVRHGKLLRGMHEVGYEAVLRHIGNLTPSASISMREAAGQSLKSAISHSWTRDTRDDALLGTRGSYFKISQEYAGLLGDASFYKGEIQSQLSRSLFPGTIVSFAARSGILHSLWKPALFPDRFQLGGPTNVRMFRANGMGPRDGPDSLGGDLYWAAGVSLISDVPHKPHWPVKTHLFVNAGRLDAMDTSKTFVDNVVSSITKPSISAGLGLVYKLDPVRIEMNVGVPLLASKSDSVRRGLQVGIGVDFL
ncbi:uncharacterized protein FIBRA_02473 [Fibroporia radiculosa]|uniref:Bacterial surface antigen (D15) domain-containing protein n=1 Tax=Fibroporia radiculosa TaxID=599839 RepID=J4I929_9APHY|nr:uncharacterized protein FIBRA_02473 [Fibroporia radiculosa]CCM00441.1 predicted protein [Fibroporia radiculosa]